MSVPDLNDFAVQKSGKLDDVTIKGVRVRRGTRIRAFSKDRLVEVIVTDIGEDDHGCWVALYRRQEPCGEHYVVPEDAWYLLLPIPD